MLMPSTIRNPLNAGLIMLLAVILVGFAVAFGFGVDADRNLLKAMAMREGADPAALIETVRWITWVGDAAPRSFLLIGFAGWLAYRKRLRSALVMLVLPPVAGVTNSMLKEAFGRARPDVVPHLDFVPSLSYPSGHAANAMAILLTAALLIPSKRRPLWIGCALAVSFLVALSRPLLGVHYPLDVVAGAAWGAGFALIALAYARRLEG
jgi:membrane-associated phospholipid phosphatase